MQFLVKWLTRRGRWSNINTGGFLKPGFYFFRLRQKNKIENVNGIEDLGLALYRY